MPSPDETGLVEFITVAIWTLPISAFQASIAGAAAAFQEGLPSCRDCFRGPSSICMVMTDPPGQERFSRA